MRTIVIAAALTATLSACGAPSPEARAANVAENAQLSQELTRGMARPAPAAVTECLRQIETGSFSAANLTNAGFRTGNVILNNAFIADVTGPVKQGLAMRPLSVGVNIGPNDAVNFQPGCKFNLPTKGNAAAAFGAFASSAATSSGYTVTSRGAGSYFFEKGGQKLLMTTTRTIGNGVSTLTAQIRRAKS